MAAITIDENVLSTCKDKVVIITGGANGIGAATASRFYHGGAHVFFSDIATQSGRDLEKSLQADTNSGNGTCCFMTVDVCDYRALLNLFETAYKVFGQIDVAIYSAGVTERPGWVIGADVDVESVKQYPKPLMDLIDINLNGCLYFTRIALAYLKDGASPSPSPTKSLTLISSAQAFQEGPGLCGYAASKTGILGLMRSLRLLAPKICNTRVNMICPWATDTAMIAAHVHLFKDNGIPLNSADEVAGYVQMVALDGACNGRAVYVGGGKGWDVEVGFKDSLEVWLGRENAEGWRLQDEVFGKLDWMESK